MNRAVRCLVAAGVLVVLSVPPVRQMLEARMTAQMLVQLPLLGAAGFLLGGAMPRQMTAWLETWNHRGLAGLVLASFAAMCWMLPRLLDASVSEPAVACAKWVSVPLLIGVPLALSWPHATFIVRGMFMLELIATLFRLGWLYLISPIRLCSNYLLDDQQRLGQLMMGAGAMLLLWLAWKLLWRGFDFVARNNHCAGMSSP